VSNFSFPSARWLRHVRLFITDAGDDNFARIPEFQVHALAAPETQTVENADFNCAVLGDWTRETAAGDQSVRGYGYQTLGPRDSSDEVVGGKNLLVGSVELERALSENWGVAVFYDAGNAFDSFSDYEIFQGAGLGVRRYTPVGPVKVDLARQLGVLDPSYRVHVSIGFAW
jgi:hypothetical protein